MANPYESRISQPGKPLGGRSYGQGAQKFSSSRYSAVTLDAVNQTYQLFQTTQASSGLAVTNMADQSQFPSGVKFIATHIGIRIFNAVSQDGVAQGIPDLRAILQNATLKFNLTGFQDVGIWSVDEWLQTENYYVNPASGVAPMFNASTTSAQFKALEIPIVLESRVLFNIELALNSIPTADIVGTKFKVILKGQEERRGA
jgi:hypothetical protein